MKNLCRRGLVYAAAAALLLWTSAASVLAQDAAKPAVVVSIANIDKLLADVGYLTRAAGTPEVGGLITLMAGQYIEGLDTRKPAGMYLNISGPQPKGVAFLPVADFDTVIAKLEEGIGEPEDLGGGVKKIELQRSIFFKNSRGWVYISDSAANLDSVPQDPSVMLGELAADYEVAVQINVQSIPRPLREMAISELRTGFERSLENAGNGGQRELQERAGKNGIENLISFIEEADQVTIGWGIDSEQGGTHLDLNVTAIEGSKLAKRFALLEGNKTNFSGFLLPNAAATFHFTSPIAPEDVEQTMLMVEMIRDKALAEIADDPDLPDAASREKAQDIVGSLINVIEETIRSGKLDGGAALLLENDTLRLVAGGYCSDGATVEEKLKELVELGKSIDDDPNLDRVQFNIESHQGVSLHTVSLPIPEREDEARKVLGDELEIVVGTGPQSVFVALGKESRGLLKQVIDKSFSAGAVDTPPVTMDIALGPILSFAAAIENQPAVTMMADALKASEGKDHVSIIARSIPGGVAYRIEVDEGVLKLIGQAAKLQGGRGNL